MRSEVIQSAVIDAPIDRVWEVLRDFGNHERWHPNVTLCQVENDLDGDVVGCVRHYRLDGETELREQLLTHSDRDHSHTCAVLDSSLPLFDNLTTLSLKPVTDTGQTLVHWSARFRTSKSRADELGSLIGRKIFTAGLTGLRSFLAQGGKPSAQVQREDRQPAATAPGEALPSRALVIESPGGPEAMVMRDQTVPAPETGQARVRQGAVPVAFLDTLERRGMAAGLDFPGTPGHAGVGEIIDLGTGVDGLFPGDRVAWLSRSSGAYGEVCLVGGNDCIHLPDGVSDLAGTTLRAGLIAGLLLGRVFRAGAGDTILVESAAAGLGHILCQWASAWDMVVMGTVRNEEQARFARDRGCAHPIVAGQGGPVLDEVMRVTNGRGVDCLALDGRGLTIDEALPCLARFGRLAVANRQGAQPASLAYKDLGKSSFTVSFIDYFDYFDDRLYRQRLAQQYFAKLQSGTIVPVVETLPMSKAGEAQENVQSHQNLGALVLLPQS